MITETDITQAAKEYFLTYAGEVLTDRAIPTAEDGLLPVQRKILWTMEQVLKMDSKSKTKKSASVVGSTLAAAYVHGDQACYGALCKIAQTYLMRYPLIIGQGSLGSQEANGMQASSRYSESKPSQFADLMFNDYNKNVIPTKPTYNNEYMEPVILPSLLPNAMINGRETVGLAISHNSLPHNLTEVCNAIIAYIKGELTTVEDVIKYIPGPDFPLGGTVINSKDINHAFETGQSLTSLKVRGDYVIDGQKIIFTSIPYRTYRNKIREQLNKNVDVLEKFLADFDDESSVGENKLVFTLKKGANVGATLNKIFALTDLETTLSYNMNFIVNGTPKMCSMLDLIQIYYKHQEDVLIKATEFDKEKAEARAHILEGLILAIGKIDEVINTIKKSTDKTVALNNLIALLGVDETQANAILNMKLSSLTKLDNKDLAIELQEKKKIIKECNKILSDQDYRNDKIIEKLTWLRDKYGDERRTKIENLTITPEEKEIKEVIPEKVVVILTEGGNIKSIPAASYKAQSRTSKGTNIQKGDIPLAIITTNTIDSLLAYSNKGRVFRIVVDSIPTGTNTSTGAPISSLIPIEDDETIQVIYSISLGVADKYMLFATANGLIKRTAVTEFSGTRKKTGTAALKLRANDKLVAVSLMNDEEILLVSKKGQCLKIDGSTVSILSKAGTGVKGINLALDDELIAAIPIKHGEENLAVFLSTGTAKNIPLTEFSIQNRGGKGVKIGYKDTEISAVAIIKNTDNLLLMGQNRQLCISGKDIPISSRIAKGNIVLKDDIVSSVTKV